jgi:hypothetical protein
MRRIQVPIVLEQRCKRFSDSRQQTKPELFAAKRNHLASRKCG